MKRKAWFVAAVLVVTLLLSAFSVSAQSARGLGLTVGEGFIDEVTGEPAQLSISYVAEDLARDQYPTPEQASSACSHGRGTRGVFHPERTMSLCGKIYTYCVDCDKLMFIVDVLTHDFRIEGDNLYCNRCGFVVQTAD